MTTNPHDISYIACNRREFGYPCDEMTPNEQQETLLPLMLSSISYNGEAAEIPLYARDLVLNYREKGKTEIYYKF